MASEDDTISVTLQLHPLLASYVPRTAVDDAVVLEVPPGTTIDTLLHEACGLRADVRVFATLEGRAVSLGTELRDGDAVSVFLAVGGG